MVTVGGLTFRCSVDGEPQLEPVRVADLNIFQLRSQKDVFLSLNTGRDDIFKLLREHKFTLQVKCYHIVNILLTANIRLWFIKLTWLANSRWHTVLSSGSFIIAVMICSMGVMPVITPSTRSGYINRAPLNTRLYVCRHPCVLWSQLDLQVRLNEMFIKA